MRRLASRSSRSVQTVLPLAGRQIGRAGNRRLHVPSLNFVPIGDKVIIPDVLDGADGGLVKKGGLHVPLVANGCNTNHTVGYVEERGTAEVKGTVSDDGMLVQSAIPFPSKRKDLFAETYCTIGAIVNVGGDSSKAFALLSGNAMLSLGEVKTVPKPNPYEPESDPMDFVQSPCVVELKKPRPITTLTGQPVGLVHRAALTDVSDMALAEVHSHSFSTFTELADMHSFSEYTALTGSGRVQLKAYSSATPQSYSVFDRTRQGKGPVMHTISAVLMACKKGAPINPGDTGSPVIDKLGKLVGFVAAAYPRGGPDGFQPLAFVLPAAPTFAELGLSLRRR